MNKNIEKIKSYEDACKDQALTPLTINDFASLPKEEQQAFFSLHKISTIRKSLNGEWKVDYTDFNQRKYTPWFYIKPGVGFSYVVYGYDFAYTVVGSRLSYCDSETAKYAGTQFIEDYKNFME